MERLRSDEDVKPLSELGANAERLMEESEVLRDVRQAEQQLEAGLGIPHVDAKARVMAALKR